MKMVILGAGASCDSIITPDLYNVRKADWCPPTGSQLFKFTEKFNEILSKYPGAESLRSEINLSVDIEDVLQKKYVLSKGPNGAGIKLKIINTEFYLSELFYKISNEYVGFGPSNYETLVSQANDYNIRTGEDVLFVTFNYDTLLEKSIERICKTKFRNINDYVNHPLKVIKPHGSCNWFKMVRMSKDIVFDLIQQKGLASYMYDNVDATIQILNSLDDNIVLANETKLSNLYFPQILVPLKTKDEFILPDNQTSILESVLKEIDEILVIGWKGNESYFHDVLKNKIGSKSLKITIVCLGDKQVALKLQDIAASVKFNHFINDASLDKTNLGAGTFSSFMRASVINPNFNFFR